MADAYAYLANIGTARAGYSTLNPDNFHNNMMIMAATYEVDFNFENVPNIALMAGASIFPRVNFVGPPGPSFDYTDDAGNIQVHTAVQPPNNPPAIDPALAVAPPANAIPAYIHRGSLFPIQPVNVVVTDANLRVFNERRRTAQAVLDNVPAAARWLLDLMACSKVRPLSRGNVKSYFTMLDVANMSLPFVMDFLKKLRPIIPSIRDSLAATRQLPTDDFMRYHTSASSTPQLIQQVIDFLGADANIVFTANTQAAVAAAINAPHDITLVRRIPERAAAITYVYLRVNQRLPETWYIGNRAYENTSPILIRMWETAFRRINAIGAPVTAINAATTPTAAINALPALALNI